MTRRSCAVGHVNTAIKQANDAAADKLLALERGGNTQEMEDYFEDDSDGGSDGDYMGGDGGDLYSLDAKKLTDLLATKDIEVEMFSKELKMNPTKTAFKAYAEQLVKDGLTKDGATAQVTKMKNIYTQMKESWGDLTAKEFHCLSTIMTSCARKMELPDVIAAVQNEKDSVEKALEQVHLKEAKEKQAKELEKKKNSKRKAVEESVARGKGKKR